MEQEFMWIDKNKNEELPNILDNDDDQISEPRLHLHTTIENGIKNWNNICWTCYYCDRIFNSFANLKTHQESSHQIYTTTDTFFECFDCKKPLLGYSSFLNHVQNCHYNALKLCCDVCNDILPNFEQLTLHREKHNEECNQIHPAIHHCTLCEEVYSSEKSLKHHIQESHSSGLQENIQNSLSNEEESYSMEAIETGDECGKTATTFECPQCARKFTNEMSLKYHMKIHNSGRTFECEKCSKQFKWERSFKKHMLTHTDAFPYECLVCREKFRYKKTLESHMGANHKKQLFKCEMCPKKFKEQLRLQNHIAKHFDERPFKCSLCSADFTTEKGLNYHMKAHSEGLPPFECKKCPKKFKRKYDFQNHMLLHSGERPFKCEWCSKAFYVQTRLKGHLNNCIEKFRRDLVHSK